MQRPHNAVGVSSGSAQRVQQRSLRGSSARHAAHKSRPCSPRTPHSMQPDGSSTASAAPAPSTNAPGFRLTAICPPLTLCRYFIGGIEAMQGLRHDWTRQEILSLFALPFNDLLERAHDTHRAHHDPNAVQVSTLLSIKTGGCPEDCAYCPQAARYHTGVQAEKLMELDDVLERARVARDAGATRFCMGAAWRSPKDRDIPKVAAMIREVRALGMETCATLGMLSAHQAEALKDAGLDYYNHNLDTAPEFYGEIIHTREYQDRLDTLEHVRDVGMKTCCGG